MAYRNRISAKRNGLRHVCTVANTAGVNEADLTTLAKIINRLACLTNGRHAGHAGVLGGEVRASARAAFHTVDVDRIRVAFHGHPHVVVNSCRAQLELDRNLPIRGFADLLNFQRQIVRTQPVGVACR